MGLFFVAIMLLAYAAALLIDWLLLLLFVRVVADRWHGVIITEVDDAARPLVDRTLRRIDRLWSRIPSRRSLRSERSLPVAAVTLGLVRFLLAVVTGLVVTVG